MKYGNFVLGMNIDFLEDQDEFDFWYKQMPEYRKAKIDRLGPLKSKMQSLGAGILLLKGLEKLGMTDAVIVEGEDKKPYIQGATDVEFNLSHSGDLVVCAFSDACVGIDVQKTKSFNRKLVNFVYKDEEIKYIKYRSETQFDMDLLCTKMWTMKESVMKYYGKGLSMDPRIIFLDQEHDNRVYHNGELLENIHFTGYEQEGYYITVCSEYENFSDEIIFVMGE
ncbi:4'-phosphopantetheinyl transferase family protein [Butyrivibrio sp. VCB2006]|uniref:4'-phosphopantetheinyl transferase family protein n=1 Tax=Butyrivibrio sp. VCB2006 TaxID=1280679 RepID=UPI0004927D5D|nr:4'-phosphopantetheinyl transferase superfamily protein [Butyrivibrio sp. VCB2006]